MNEATKGILGLIAVGCMVLIVLATGGLAIFAHGVRYGEDRNRAEAIEANVGRWVIDEKTGAKQFVYGVAP